MRVSANGEENDGSGSTGGHRLLVFVQVSGWGGVNASALQRLTGALLSILHPGPYPFTFYGGFSKAVLTLAHLQFKGVLERAEHDVP